MGLGNCKLCGSSDIIVGSTAGILCNGCGLAVKADTLKEAEDRWNNLEIRHVGEEEGKARAKMFMGAVSMLPLALGFEPLALNFNPVADMIGRIGRKKPAKVMGPGKGTNRMRRIRKGQKP